MKTAVLIFTFLFSINAYASIITSSANDFFLGLYANGWTQSTTNEWQLGRYDTSGDFVLHGNSGGDANWANFNSENWFGGWLNISGSDQNWTGTDVSAGGLVLHPGNDAGETSVLRFVAQSSTMFDISALFTSIDTTQNGGDGVGVSLMNGTASLANQTIQFGSPTPSFFYTNSVILSAGDFIDFQVSNAGNYLNDSTLIDASVSFTEVPAPATIGLLGLSLIAMRLFNKK